VTGAAKPAIELPPGYYLDRWYGTGAWCSLPWPERIEDLPASLGPALIAWAEWRTYERTGVPGLIHPIWGGPWEFTPGQRRFLHQWFSYGPDSGRWLFRRGVKRGAKGTGKDPFLAALCALELLGPVQLARDPGTGRWVGVRRRMPLVQIMSNSQEQSKDVLRVMNGMLGAETREFFDIDVGETRTILRDTGGRVEIPTSSEASAEGDPATFIALNETHHMTRENGGHRVAAVARRNVGKSPADLQARMVDATNAHLQGEDSTAERTYEAWQLQVSGQTVGKVDILYDSIEAPADTDLADEASRRRGLAAAYADAPWADLERLEGEALDPETPPGDSTRYYLNGLGEEADAWCSPVKFRALGVTPDLAESDQVALFIDCSKSGDATVVVGCRLRDELVFVLGCWSPPPGKRGEGWRAPREVVDATVRAAFSQYRVVWMGVDPSPARDDEDDRLYWMPTIDGWHRDFHRSLRVWPTGAKGTKGGHSVLFDMRIKTPGGALRNQQFTQAAMQTRLEIDDLGTLRHDGDSRLIAHASNARRRPNPWGESLSKVSRGSGKLVDLAVGMVGAKMGARIALNSGRVRLRSGEASF
jgi:hypothetical protein